MMPLVCTAITTRNRAAMLPGAIRSALAQTDAGGKPIAQEIVIVDDGSTDDTRAVAEKFVRDYPGIVRYVPTRTGSCAGTRNAGIREATAPFFALLDDDDEWLPGRLQKALARFDESPGAALVYGQAIPTDADLQPMPDAAPAFPERHLMMDGHPVEAFLTASPHMNAVLFRRPVFDKHGVFDESLSGFEDTDLMVRIARHEVCLALPEPLTLMRFHTDALNNADRMWKRFVDETRSRQSHFAVIDAHRPPFARRLKINLANRGWYVHRFLTCAAASAAAGNTGAAWQAVLYALKASPLHTLKSPLFWNSHRARRASEGQPA